MIIQTPHFKAQQSLLDFVQQKVEKLELLTDRITESKVFLKLDKSDNRENKICEVMLLIPGNELFASAQCNSFEEAAVKATEALKHQLERWKGSLKVRVDNPAAPQEF